MRGGHGRRDGAGGPGRRPRPLLVLPAGDDVVVVDASARRRGGRGAGQPRPDAPVGTGDARRRAGRGARRRRGRRWSTWPGWSWRPRRRASPPSAPSRPPPTPRCACSSAGPSPPSRPSSTTAPTCSWPPSWPPPRCGTRPGRRPTAATSSHATPRPWPPRWRWPRRDECAQLNIQVHGGIGFTWEHDAHLYLRRATALAAVVDAEAAARDVTDLVRRGVRRTRHDRPAARGRAAARRGARLRRRACTGLDAAAQRDAMIETGYVMPHWPKPWGRDAGAVEQLVIEQEFAVGRRGAARSTASRAG